MESRLGVYLDEWEYLRRIGIVIAKRMREKGKSDKNINPKSSSVKFAITRLGTEPTTEGIEAKFATMTSDIRSGL